MLSDVFSCFTFTETRILFVNFLTEGMGFEPMGAKSSAELAIRFFRPLRHPSKNNVAKTL